jgi:hypothetical protein
MVISQGDIWWAALPEPVGSGPGYDRPVVIAQGDTFNRSQLATIVVIPLTTNTRLAALPGNVLLPSGSTAHGAGLAARGARLGDVSPGERPRPENRGPRAPASAPGWACSLEVHVRADRMSLPSLPSRATISP